MSAETFLKDSAEYKYGFVTEVETDALPKGLNEDIVRAISDEKRRTRFYVGFPSESLSEMA